VRHEAAAFAAGKLFPKLPLENAQRCNEHPQKFSGLTDAH
jgi:hypothetical protein